MDNPSVMKPEKPFAGDIESMAAIREKTCGYDIMTRIECRTADGHIPSDRTNETLSCDRIRGLRCKNALQADKKCMDYEVRAYCDCSNVTTAPPGGTTRPISGITTKTVDICGWTTWMNGHHPDKYGDVELLSELENKYRFCHTDEITAIECRDSITGLSSMEAGQSGVICDINAGGLKCDATKQLATGGQCYDYEIRVLCEPKGVPCGPSTEPNATPLLVPLTDIYGKPVTDKDGHTIVVPVTSHQGTPTAVPATDKFGNPVLVPKTDIYGQPVTDSSGNTVMVTVLEPIPGGHIVPTAVPKTDKFGNPIDPCAKD